MWSLYVGRPVALEYKHITLQLPSGTAGEIVDKYWESYVDQPDGVPTIRLLDPIQDMTKYNVLLCAKMESIRDVLYVFQLKFQYGHANRSEAIRTERTG
jgi:hypothetical protein